MNQDTKTIYVTFALLILSSIAYGFFMDETFLHFLANHGSTINGNLPYRKGFFLLLAPSFLFFAPFLGDLSDRIGRKKILSICSYLLIFTYMMSIFAYTSSSIPLRIATNWIFGVSMGFWAVAYATLFDLSRKTKRLKYVVYLIAITHLGFFAATLFNHNFKILHSNPIITLYLALGLQTICSLIIFFLFKQPKPTFPDRNKTEHFKLFSQRITRLFASPKARNAYFISALYILTLDLYTATAINQPIGGYYILHAMNNLNIYSYCILTFSVPLIFILKKALPETKRIILYGSLLVILGVAWQSVHVSHNTPWIPATLISLGLACLSTTVYFLSSARSPRFYGLMAGLFVAMWALISIFANIIIYTLNKFLLPDQSFYSIMLLIVFIMIFLYFFTSKRIKG